MPHQSKLTPDQQTAIKHHEARGGQPVTISYQCGARKWSIGYGHTDGVEEGDTCTPHQAELWFQEDLADAEASVERLFPGQEFESGMYAALVSFLFNFGETKLRGYFLHTLIRNGAEAAMIFRQWLKYQYTIRDEDADGDLDAMIDRGLPIRRYREVLMARGFSWAVQQAAANENNLDLKEERVPWKNGGFKERLVSRTSIEDVLERAEAIALFEAEEEIIAERDAYEAKDAADFDDEDFDIPRRGAPRPEKPAPAPEMPAKPIEPVVPERHPDGYYPENAAKPPEPLVSDDLNAQQAQRLRNPETASVMAPSVIRNPAVADPQAKVIPVEAVDYLAEVDRKPGNITTKRIEKSRRGKGFAKQSGGKELALIGSAGVVAEYVGVTEPVLRVVEKYPRQTVAWVIGGLLIFGLLWYAIGAWQRDRGEDGAEDLMR